MATGSGRSAPEAIWSLREWLAACLARSTASLAVSGVGRAGGPIPGVPIPDVPFPGPPSPGGLPPGSPAEPRPGGFGPASGPVNLGPLDPAPTTPDEADAMVSLIPDELVPPEVAPQAVWIGVEVGVGAGGVRVPGVDPLPGGTTGGATVQAATARLRRIAETPTRQWGPKRAGMPGRARPVDTLDRYPLRLSLELLDTPIGVSSSGTRASWIHARGFRSNELLDAQSSSPNSLAALPLRNLGQTSSLSGTFGSSAAIRS